MYTFESEKKNDRALDTLLPQPYCQFLLRVFVLYLKKMKLCQYIISVTIPYPAGSIQLYSVWVIKALINAVGIDIFLQPKSSIFFKVVCKILKLPCDFLVDYKIQQYRVFYNINLFCKISESHKNTQFFKGKSTNLRNSQIFLFFREVLANLVMLSILYIRLFPLLQPVDDDECRAQNFCSIQELYHLSRFVYGILQIFGICGLFIRYLRVLFTGTHSD